MKVYTLTGKSGTGKSYQAINLCKEKNIVSIIDDGLFIYKNRVEAEYPPSAQKTMAGAHKTALFTLDEAAFFSGKTDTGAEPIVSADYWNQRPYDRQNRRAPGTAAGQRAHLY